MLIDALRDAVARVESETVAAEMAECAPKKARRILAKAGIRDEEVFPVPSVLRERPTLVGYYRLLLGTSQKQFYASGAKTGPFKAMEQRGVINAKAELALEEFCKAMGMALTELIDQMSPRVSQRDVLELPLLTLGSQFQGSNNNKIGQAATDEVFLAIEEIVEPHLKEAGPQEIVLENSAGRTVHIVLSADPDVRIEEQFGGERRPLVAIEIKGGTDRSNAHNRAGEAEKSHQKAKARGFRDCWTVIAKSSLDLTVLKAESPTTNAWFDTGHVLDRDGEDWEEFQTRIAGSVGIPI